MRRASPLWWLLGAAFVVYLVAPLLLVVVFAFTNRAITNFPIEHLSLAMVAGDARASAVPPLASAAA